MSEREPIKRRRRLSIFDDGHDYVILRIAQDKSLHPMPDVPRFTSCAHARRWLTLPDAEALAGMRIAIVRFHSIADLVAQQRVTVKVVEKARAEKREPEAESKPRADSE